MNTSSQLKRISSSVADEEEEELAYSQKEADFEVYVDDGIGSDPNRQALRHKSLSSKQALR